MRGANFILKSIWIFLFSTGLVAMGQTQLFSEDFTTTSIPAGWTQEFPNGSVSWVFKDGGSFSNPPKARKGAYNATFYPAAVGNTTKLVSPPIDLSGNVAAYLTFWHAQPIYSGSYDELKVYYKTSAGGAWTLLEHYSQGITRWCKQTIPLPNLTSTYYIAFEAVGYGGDAISIDDINIYSRASAFPTYCTGTSTNGPATNRDRVRNVSFHQIYGPDGLFTNNWIQGGGIYGAATLVAGQYHHGAMQDGATVGGRTLLMWIDFNQDGDFNDAGEQVAKQYFGSGTGNIISFYFNVPATATPGRTKARVRCVRSTSASNPASFTACTTNGTLQTQTVDYDVFIEPSIGNQPLVFDAPNLITSGASNLVYTSRVQLGNIDNSSVAFGNTGVLYNYSNYMGQQSTELEANQNYTLTVTHSNYTCTVGAWIDWNNDGDFNDTDEKLGATYAASGTQKTINFTVPSFVTNGTTVVMRVRTVYDNVTSNFTATNLPAGWAANSRNNNETEDYTVHLIGNATCTGPTLAPEANGESPLIVCAGGTSVTLTANGTGGTGCAGNTEFAWSNGTNYWNGTAFSSATAVYNTSYSSISFTASTTATYTAYSQCSTDNTCTSNATVVVSVLDAPANLAAIIGAPANGTQHHITVSWNAVSGATGYDLDFAPDGSTWTNIASNTSSTSFDHNRGDNPNTPSYYRVRARNGAVICSYSTMATPVYTAADVPALPSLTNISGTSLDLSLVAETPVANPAITTYSIYSPSTGQYVQANGSLGATEVFQTAAAWGTVTVTGLSLNTQYCFYAKARNNDGDIRSDATGLSTAWGTGAVEDFDSYSSVDYCGLTISQLPWMFCTLSAPNGVWTATPTAGCGTNAIQYTTASAQNGSGSLMRSAVFSAVGQNTVVVSFDMTNSFNASYTTDRIYMWVQDWSFGGGFYNSNVSTPTQNVYFDQARNCQRVQLTFDITSLPNKNNLTIGMWSNAAAGSPAHSFNVVLDDFGVTTAAATACATTLSCVDPTVYNVTGGTICSSGAIGLSGSQLNVNYQLVRDGSTNVGTPVAGTGNAISFGTQSTNGAYTVVATTSIGGCTEDMNGSSSVTTCGPNSWIGTTNEWHNAANWTANTVPLSCADNITIPFNVPNFPVISVASVNVGNITVESGVVITLQGRDMNVCGDWTGGSGSNAAVVGSGTIYMNSPDSAQLMAGNTVFDVLQINNSQGVSLVGAGKVSIARGLHLQSGVFSVSGGTFRLLSTAANNNSYIDDFTAGFGGSITGAITADRYVPVAGYNQHFISSPLAGTALSQIGASGPNGQYIIPTANCDETQSDPLSPYGTVFTYVDGHAAPGACMLGNWRISSAGNMIAAKGYSAYLAGNRVLSVTGVANTGPLSVGDLNNSGYPTVPTLQGQPVESGWNLVGNPYPSAIDLTTSRTADGFQNQVQIWRTTGPFAGSWQVGIINGIAGSVVLPPFQAFMVRVIPGSLGLHTYNFYQAERSRSINTTFYRTESENALALEVDYNGVKDITKVEFNPTATTKFDDIYDANKYSGSPGRPTLYTTYANTWYAINTLPSLNTTTSVPVGLRPEVNGTMTISPTGIETFDATTYILLEDKKTGIWHNLRNGAYTFTTAKSDAQNRFMLHFTPAARILTSDANCETNGMINVEQAGNTIWNYTLTDVNSIVLASGILNQTNPVSVSAGVGVYTLTLSDNAGYTVVKSVQVGGFQQVNASFTASASSVQVSEEVAFSSGSNATVHTWNFGDGTSGTGASVVHQYQTEGVYTVTLTVTNVEGCTSVSTRTITVTSRSATGIDKVSDENGIYIWSADNRVFVDFSKQKRVEAQVEIYNILGQLISSEKFGTSTVYSRDVTDMEATYMIVRVINDDKVYTKKVFLSDSWK